MIYELVNWFFIVFELLKTIHIPFKNKNKKGRRRRRKRPPLKKKKLPCTTHGSTATLYNFKDSKVAQSIRNHNNSLSEGNNSNQLNPLLRAKTYFKKSWLEI